MNYSTTRRNRANRNEWLMWWDERPVYFPTKSSKCWSQAVSIFQWNQISFWRTNLRHWKRLFIALNNFQIFFKQYHQTNNTFRPIRICNAVFCTVPQLWYRYRTVPVRNDHCAIPCTQYLVHVPYTVQGTTADRFIRAKVRRKLLFGSNWKALLLKNRAFRRLRSAAYSRLNCNVCIFLLQYCKSTGKSLSSFPRKEQSFPTVVTIIFSLLCMTTQAGYTICRILQLILWCLSARSSMLWNQVAQ